MSFQKATGTTFQFVPYRGDGPAVQDMMAGQIDMMIEPSSNFTAQVKAGTIRAIAVPSKTRMTSLPEVPTDGRSRAAGLLCVDLVRHVGAEGHAAGRPRQDPCRDRRGAEERQRERQAQ